MKVIKAPEEGSPEDGADALIKEARRRQHKRYLVAALAVAVVMAGALGVLASLGTTGAPRPKTPVKDSTRQTTPALSGIDASVFMWPVGYPAFGPNGGPPAYVDDLLTGRLSQRQVGIGAGDYQPLLISVGHWLVYVGNGATAIPDDLKGTPRVLGTTPFFAPSAAPDHVWLIYSPAKSGPVIVRSVAVAGGPLGPAIKLPIGSQLMEGTEAGLLLRSRSGDAELWRPGAAPKVLPHSVPGEWTNMFDATPLLVAYGTGCSDEITSSNASYEPDAGYTACQVLRVFNVVTGRLLSIPTPPGTAGWVPTGLGLVDAFSPRDAMIAAEAVVPPDNGGHVRLYVVPLTTHVATRPKLVPRSSAFLFARTAWSPDGSWLFYQGPRTQLWAYRVASGLVKSSRTPCCQYTVMVAVPPSS